MKNLKNEKYILQETRPLKENEFVYRYTDRFKECACKDRQFWEHLMRYYNVDHERIDDISLPEDSNGNKMWGIRVKKLKIWNKKDE